MLDYVLPIIIYNLNDQFEICIHCFKIGLFAAKPQKVFFYQLSWKLNNQLTQNSHQQLSYSEDWIGHFILKYFSVFRYVCS